MRARLGTYKDLPRLLVLLGQAHRSSEYRHIPVHIGKARKSLSRFLNPSQKNTVVFVLDGEPLGGALLGMVDYHWWSPYRYATDILTYTRQAGRGHGEKLYRAFIAWAEAQGNVAEVTFSASTELSDPEKLARFYQRLGCVRTGMTWTKFLTLEDSDVRRREVGRPHL